jgi:hypothetical protein
VTSTLQHTPVWPFLVGRGRRKGYQTLLAPGFLIEQDMHETLAEATPSVPVGVLGRARVSCPGVGPLTLAYTTEGIATGRIDSGNGVGEWTDEHGRPLEMLYGVVAHEPLSDTLAVNDLQRAREDALEAYGGFLAHEDDFSVGASQQYSLPRQAPDHRQRQSDASITRGRASQRSDRRPVDRDREGLRPAHGIQSHRPPDPVKALHQREHAATTVVVRQYEARQTRLREQTRRVLGLVALAAVILASGLWLLGRGRTASVSIIDTSAAPANSDTCASATQLKLQASLTAGGRVRIQYRWLPTAKLASGSIPEESITVGSNPQTISNIRDASAGPYRLVIDNPGSKQSGPLTCRSPQASAPAGNGPTASGQSPVTVEP